ncbi:hypothetical protein BN903_340 [Halorubrum sp. AJ67]|nr:hypothetical protein BN903_340 [Halorubrum sp. AJ67]
MCGVYRLVCRPRHPLFGTLASRHANWPSSRLAKRRENRKSSR